MGITRRHGGKVKAISWDRLRFEVYDRDKGICDVCRRLIALDEFECGHIVDRCASGEDSLENLVVMCSTCNRVLKPVHDTLEQYEDWKRTDPYAEYVSGMFKAVFRDSRVKCEHERAGAEFCDC